jgi:hypothetical protein
MRFFVMIIDVFSNIEAEACFIDLPDPFFS